MPSDIFFKNLLTNPAKHFLKVLATVSVVFFSEHIPRKAILIRVSVITCKYNF